MKKHIIAVLLSASLLSRIPIISYASDIQPEVAGETTIETSDKKLEFKSYDLGTDYDGNPMIILHFDYSNFSSEAAMIATNFFITVYQNGIQREMAFPGYPFQFQDEYDNSLKNLKDGASLTICQMFTLEDTNSPIEIDIQDFSDWSHHTLNIDISAYNTSDTPASEQSDSTSSEAETEDTTNWEQKYNELLIEYQELEKQFEEYKAAYPESDNTDSPSSSIEEDLAYLSEQLNGIERGTSTVVDKLASIAKSDIALLTEDDIEQIVSVIRTNYPDYYDDLQYMELYMYYGYLLYYSFDDFDPRSTLGLDLVQAVKNVYRNVESISDDFPQINLEQVSKSLSNIPE